MSDRATCLPVVEPAFEPLEPRLLLSGEAAAATAGAAEASALAPEVARLVEQNNAFAFDLYEALREQNGSLFFSPLSVSAALAMTYAGAAGRTADQMADTFHWDAAGEDLAQAFHDLIAILDRDEAAADPDAGDTLTLDIANAMWGKEGFPFLQAFADVLESAYGAPLDRLDFVGDPEGAADEINAWVNEATRGLIPQAVSPKDFNTFTRFVLANAIYFNGSWEHAFNEDATRTQAFHLPDGDVHARLMHQTEWFRYGETEDYQVLELPYAGGASMVVLLPREGRFEAVEESLSDEMMDDILVDMQYRHVAVTLPKIDCKTTYDLAGILSAMGMPDAFTGAADFSGMSNVPLHIDTVKHLARIKMDESTTEAAAVTIISGVVTGSIGWPPPPVVFRADRPFIYTIRDTETDSTVFLGRVSDATALVLADGEDAAGDDGSAELPESDPPYSLWPLPPGTEPLPFGPILLPPGFPAPKADPVDLVRPEPVAASTLADAMAAPEVALLVADAQATPVSAGGGASDGETAVTPPAAPAFAMLADALQSLDLDVLPDALSPAGDSSVDAEASPAPVAAAPAPAEASPASTTDPLADRPLDALAGEALTVVFAE
jgi:serpin B